MRQQNHVRASHRSRLLLPTLVVVAALAACGTDEIVNPPYQPELLGIQVLENPHNTISAKVVVEARFVDSAYVRFWRDGEAPRRSPSYFFGGDTVVTVPVLGLDTAAIYTIETGIVILDSVVPGVDTSVFETGSLPDWIAAIGTQGSDTTPGFLALSYEGGPVIVDNTGRVVWYREFPYGRFINFEAHQDGSYTLRGNNDSTHLFHVLDDLGEEVDSLKCIGLQTRFHDIHVFEDGSAWIFCDETRVMDLTAYGGLAAAEVFATVVQRLSPDGEVLWEWNAFDHVEITDLPPPARTRPRINLTHGNSMAFDTEGHLLLSFRRLDQVMSVDTTTGDVLWRLGGVRSDFTFVNDPEGGFDGQHGAVWSGPDMIQLFDNQDVAPSRFVRYLLNPTAGTALMIVEFIDTPQTFTGAGGGTDFFPNGHAAVTFGEAGRVVELDESGNRAWELTGLDGVRVFRVQRISSLYAPERIAAGR